VLHIAGGGLAGCEAAHRAAANGLGVVLWEMKPGRFSPAHRSESLAELVCSNSFRSEDPLSAVGLLKEEMVKLGSVTMAAALATRVPAGKALAVDRELFSAKMTELTLALPGLSLRREEMTAIPEGDFPVVVAAGPLASEGLCRTLSALTGEEGLYFYDALAPIVSAESLDMSRIFQADRYGEGPGDYLNCPLDREGFQAFIEALLEADLAAPRPFEEERHFEGCLPIEVMARRGPRTLSFGPMKPVGLIDPRTGRRPAAVVQLRRENSQGSLWNLVGFQTRLTRGAQEKVFRLIPGLERAEFMRYGAIHRNTYLEAPKVLDLYQRFHACPRIFAAGQISGVEGYLESAAQGLMAGENASRLALGRPLLTPPPESAIGSLLSHLRPWPGRKGPFSPSNVNFGLFPAPPEGTPRQDVRPYRLEAARQAISRFLMETSYAL
jgi:methylenetetrahydrofolate--tRNA-(uracil-5-)-methyltransferase